MNSEVLILYTRKGCCLCQTLEKKLSNIDKKLEKSRVEKIFPKFQEVYKNE